MLIFNGMPHSEVEECLLTPPQLASNDKIGGAICTQL